ncbi:SMP-30/gluconolactonase/LRE family protein [Bordetella sp. BOR01]|uniref:SMP-30/gluconolactonase/LRE family protein n=1 Tax=Bordetella sp. BOR01 TaxID=2854779 RepID=UPI001C43AF9B|nr:SMP-30/gluconolactonase/LRE family protein [Bordetella sp. BOR01]MBV7483177.1 SMP-30/gluconolactonase/LRE family protein [Bordetella sp. BOR01]
MYPAPPVIRTEVFTRIPDQYRKAGQLSKERLHAGKGTLATDSYIEGPSFDRDGNLYLVDIAFGLVFRVSPMGKVTLLAEYDGEPNGLKIHRDGRIFIADHKNGLLLLDPGLGTLTPYLRRARTEGFKGLNDLYFASNGDLYFTDQGQTGMQDPTGRVYRSSADGRLECLLGNVPSPNGIVMNPAENLLYVAATRGNSVWRAMVLPDRSLTRVGLFVQMSGGSGPDGMAVDQAGNLLVAHAGLGAVWMFSPHGEPLLRIDSCMGRMTTNIAFGGNDNRDLYITESESGCVLVARMEIPGQPMYSHHA